MQKQEKILLCLCLISSWCHSKQVRREVRVCQLMCPPHGDGYANSWSDKQTHIDVPPPVHCTAAAFACTACVSAWLLIHVAGVHVAEFLTCPLLSWEQWVLQPTFCFLQIHSSFIFFLFMSSQQSAPLVGFHCKPNIKMFEWILYYFQPPLPFFLIFHRKELRNLRVKLFISDIAI